MIIHINLSSIEGLKEYSNYSITNTGEVWSIRSSGNKRIVTTKHNLGYERVRLYHKGKWKDFMIHKLVALAFIETDNTSLSVRHKNGNLFDNRVENLYWYTAESRKEYNAKRENKVETEEIGMYLGNEITNEIELVRKAMIMKGRTVPDPHSFTNQLIKTAITDYVIRWGLKKELYKLSVEDSM